MFDVEGVRDRLAALMAPPLRPPDGLGDMPDALDELAARELYGLEAHEAMTVLPPTHAGVGPQPLPAVA